MQVQPYLNFDGRCEEALEFYKNALGAEVMFLMRFKDSPDPAMRPPTGGEKIMHSTFSIAVTLINASDGQCGGASAFKGFSLSISVPAEAEAERLFGNLADGGRVDMPLATTFFAKRFGIVVDRFGLCWMVMVPAAAPAAA